jgi:hypothetical protein
MTDHGWNKRGHPQLISQLTAMDGRRFSLNAVNQSPFPEARSLHMCRVTTTLK